MNRTLASLAAAALLGGGTLLHSLSGPAGRETIALEPVKERLIFVGIQADYDALAVEEAARVLKEEFGLLVAGDSLRSMSDVQRRVWAFRAEDPDAALKALKRNAKKKDLVVERLHASVVSADRDPFSNSFARAAEAVDKRVWAAWVGVRGQDLWLFHEPKLTPKALEKALGAAKLPSRWQHHAFDLSCAAETLPDLAALELAAAEKLDLVHAVRGETGLTLDLYLRGLESLAVFPQASALRYCPDIRTQLVDAAAPGSAGWKLTYQADAYPFL